MSLIQMVATIQQCHQRMRPAQTCGIVRQILPVCNQTGHHKRGQLSMCQIIKALICTPVIIHTRMVHMWLVHQHTRTQPVVELVMQSLLQLRTVTCLSQVTHTPLLVQIT